MRTLEAELCTGHTCRLCTLFLPHQQLNQHSHRKYCLAINTATVNTTCGHEHSHCKQCLQAGTKAAEKSLLSFMNVGSRSDGYDWKRPDLEAMRAVSQSALSSFMVLMLYNSDSLLYKHILTKQNTLSLFKTTVLGGA